MKVLYKYLIILDEMHASETVSSEREFYYYSWFICYLELNDMDNALLYLNEFKLMRNGYDFDIAFGYLKYGCFLKNSGNIIHSYNYLNKSQIIFESILPKDHIFFAYFNNEYGIFYGNANKIQESIKFYQKRDDILSKKTNDIDFYLVLLKIAGSLINNNEYSKALSMLEEFKSFIIENNSISSIMLCKYYEIVSIVLINLEDYKNATDNIEIIININEKINNINNTDLAIAYTYLGICYFQQDFINKSSEFLQKSEQMLYNIIDKSNPKLLIIYYSIFYYYLRIGNDYLAVKYLQIYKKLKNRFKNLRYVEEIDTIILKLYSFLKEMKLFTEIPYIENNNSQPDLCFQLSNKFSIEKLDYIHILPNPINKSSAIN